MLNINTNIYFKMYIYQYKKHKYIYLCIISTQIWKFKMYISIYIEHICIICK